MEDDAEAFSSITWDDHTSGPAGPAVVDVSSLSSSPPSFGGVSSNMHRRSESSASAGTATGAGAAVRPSYDNDGAPTNPHAPRWDGFLVFQVGDPVKELEGQKEAFISYGIQSRTNLPHFLAGQPPGTVRTVSVRRRFQDFVFLHDTLSRDFPACVVPPLPGKHRMEYITGDRFSPEFLERRTADLQRFLDRLARHPTLQRTPLLRAFLESSEWNVEMHTHASAASSAASATDGGAGVNGSGGGGGLLDNLSDTLLNAFSKLRKPDERFMEMREGLDKFEDALGGVDRVAARARARQADLALDYEDLGTAVEGLAYLESGITEPLNRFAATLLEQSRLTRLSASHTHDSFVQHLHSLLSYASAHRTTIKLRDQKQLDFEELTDYLSNVVSERDRLGSLGRGGGHGAVSGGGLTGYLKDRVDALRGVDEERARVQRMGRLDGRIKELQEAVSSSHDTSLAFSDEVMREHAIFDVAKRAEMKDMLARFADGHIEMYRRSMEAWERLIPLTERGISTD